MAHGRGEKWFATIAPEDEDDRFLEKIMADRISADGHLHDATAKWNARADEKILGACHWRSLLGLGRKELEERTKLSIQIDGDTAVAVDPTSSNRVPVERLVKLNGEWKVKTEKPGEEGPAMMAALVPIQTETVNAVATGIETGTYKTVDEAVHAIGDVLDEVRGRARARNNAPQRPSTRP